MSEPANPYAAPQSSVLASNEETTWNGPPELAGRGARFVASFVDNICVLIVSVPAMFAMGMMNFDNPQQQAPFHMTLLLSLIAWVAYLIFHGYLIATSGQTIGKKLLGIQMVSEETGEILPLGRIVGLRLAPVWIAGLVPAVGQFFGLIDALFIFREDRRCLHDLIAGTQVIKLR